MFFENTINYHKHGTMHLLWDWNTEVTNSLRNQASSQTKELCIDWDWVTPHWAQWGKPGKTWQRTTQELTCCIYMFPMVFSCLILEITLHLHPKCQIWHKSTVATWPEGSQRVLCKLICLVCMLWSNENMDFPACSSLAPWRVTVLKSL